MLAGAETEVVFALDFDPAAFRLLEVPAQLQQAFDDGSLSTLVQSKRKKEKKKKKKKFEGK